MDVGRARFGSFVSLGGAYEHRVAKRVVAVIVTAAYGREKVAHPVGRLGNSGLTYADARGEWEQNLIRRRAKISWVKLSRTNRYQKPA